MARIGVLLSVENQQPGDAPRHYVSKTLRTLALRDRMNGRPVAQTVSDCIILIVAHLTIKELKERYRSTSIERSRPIVIPKLRPPHKIEPNLNLSYPVRWMESNGDLLQKEVWMRNQSCPADCSQCKQERVANANWHHFPDDEPIFWLFRNA